MTSPDSTPSPQPVIATPHADGRSHSTAAPIEIDALTHRYGDRSALNDVSFAVQTGQIFGLLGPNGGGKTTLFRILCTLLRPTAGLAKILGHNVVDQADEVRRCLGTVFQSVTLDGKLTVIENLRHQGHLYGVTGPPLLQRIHELLDVFHLTDRSRDRVETLSGGLVRRADLAKGLLHGPRVLLLDEPSTGLDPQARRELWHYLDTVRRGEQITILMTTHYMDEAARCDCVGIIDQGRLVAMGSPDDLKSSLSGESLTLETPDAPALARQIADRLGVPAVVVEDCVRVEHPAAHRLVPELIDAFPAAIRSVMVSKPSLEEVFTHYTGRRFTSE